jgi:hypothetical protein
MQNIWGLIAVRHFVASTYGPLQARGAMVLVGLYVRQNKIHTAHTNEIHTRMRYTYFTHIVHTQAHTKNVYLITHTHRIYI